MEISSVNFIHLFRPNQEHLRKMQLRALWLPPPQAARNFALPANLPEKRACGGGRPSGRNHIRAGLAFFAPDELEKTYLIYYPKNFPEY